MKKVRSSIHPEKCTKCGICAEYCPMHAISQREDGVFFVNQQHCIACCSCLSNCGDGAVEMVEVEIL